MNSNEFGILMRVLKFMESRGTEGMNELVREFQNELSDEQMDAIIKEFKFHDVERSHKKGEHKGPTPGAERFDFF